MEYLEWITFVLMSHAVSNVSGQTSLTPDPCVTYSTLHDDYGRSPNQTVTDNPICDRRINSGWYRLGPDGLYNQCVPPEKCGTVYPIWLRGELPVQVDGIVNRTACISTDNDCCELQYSIKVQMCQDFPVFFLGQTNGCDQAYCYVNPTPATTVNAMQSDRSSQADTTKEKTKYSTWPRFSRAPRRRPTKPSWSGNSGLNLSTIVTICVSMTFVLTSVVVFLAIKHCKPVKVDSPPNYDDLCHQKQGKDNDYSKCGGPDVMKHVPHKEKV